MGIIRKMKRTAEQEEAARVERESKKQFGQWFREVLKSGRDFADDKHREFVAGARAKILPDLMEICGVAEPSQIDYDNPHVKILLLNCDPVNQMMLKNFRTRQKVYNKMDEDT